VGPDGKSLRVFVSRVDGKDTEFFLKGDTESDQPVVTKTAAPTDMKAVASAGSTAATPAAVPAIAKPWIMLDTTTASEWNFQGCAVSGPSLGKCLDRVPALKDYWFDWRNYHHDTSVYKH
jgi:hypothetical protein